ncbi:MAG: hypothetical protein A3F72_11820 [Bacteroidetes bacterium RIFCSPLOWO2_12_FULL_35_15]|nr:MAG: hypothetical protein A3F72_11820 [Bacteroidetes bacterium RIFCSPLOWO2_12_FULL_35_15]
MKVLVRALAAHIDIQKNGERWGGIVCSSSSLKNCFFFIMKKEKKVQRNFMFLIEMFAPNKTKKAQMIRQYCFS